jgi:hypothetical protein
MILKIESSFWFCSGALGFIFNPYHTFQDHGLLQWLAPKLAEVVVEFNPDFNPKDPIWPPHPKDQGP